jgi:hypothetical protein
VIGLYLLGGAQRRFNASRLERLQKVLPER